MRNIVPCKRCEGDFEYSPGPAGNARQFCDKCRRAADKEEIENVKREMMTSGNRYLIGAPKRKNEFDPVDILLYGEVPDFKSDSDRFVCVMEMAEFVKNNGIAGIEDGLARFFNEMPLEYFVLFVKNSTLRHLEVLVKDKRFDSLGAKICGLF